MEVGPAAQDALQGRNLTAGLALTVHVGQQARAESQWWLLARGGLVLTQYPCTSPTYKV